MNSWGYAFRELGRRRGRSLLSLLSVVIAVAAIVAVTSATATTRRAYKQVYEALAGRAEVEVVARGGGRFKQKVTESIRDTAGVRTTVPVFHRATKVFTADHVAAKVLAVGIVKDEPESVAGYEITQGDWPSAATEIALEWQLAEGLHLKPGDEVRLLTGVGLRKRKVAGLFSLENAARLHQGGMVLAPISNLQQVFKSSGEVDALHLYLNDPNQTAEVIAAVHAKIPEQLEVRVPSSRSGLAEEMLLLTEVSLDMCSALSFTTAVVIALSVFLMNVGERRRQLSILRAVGATRRQIVGIVCREAIVMGIIGTLVGIPLGVYGGRFLMRSMGAMLNTTLPETPDLRWALAVGGLLGPLICLLAAWYPARKAASVSPLEGMRPLVTMQPERGHGKMTMAGLIGLAITGVLSVGSVTGTIPIWSAVVGLIISLVSLLLLLPVALVPGVRAVNWFLGRLLGIEGEMSQRMVLRHAGRSALTVGVLLIAVSAGVGTSNAVFSITDDVSTWYERTITADFLLRTTMPDMSGQDATSMPESLREEIAAIPGIEKVEAIRLLRVEASGQDAMVVAREFGKYEQAPLDIVRGDATEALAKLREGEAVVGSVLAERLKVKPGDEVSVIFGDQSQKFRVAGIATEYTFGGSVLYVELDVARKLFKVQGVDSFLIKAMAQRPAELEPSLRALSEKHGLLLQSFGELQRLIDSMVAGVTGGLWVLLALGLLVGALGVVNTLTMNVLDQTRELGMLRAIGMRRLQVVKTVMGQAAYLGLLGVLGGGASGLILARMINFCLGSMFGHYVAFALRPQFIFTLLSVAMAVVLISALVPARRASALNAIQAMRQD